MLWKRVGFRVALFLVAVYVAKLPGLAPAGDLLFFGYRQRNLRKRKATRSLGPCASLRATSGARSQPSQDGVGNECKVKFGDALTPALSRRERE